MSLISSAIIDVVVYGTEISNAIVLRPMWAWSGRLQHCLEWVLRVYMGKPTLDSVVTYLFHDCERSLWLFCLVSSQVKSEFNTYVARAYVGLRWSKFRTRQRSVSEINIAFPCGSIWFSCQFAGFHVANQEVTLLLLLSRSMKSFSTFL